MAWRGQASEATAPGHAAPAGRRPKPNVLRLMADG